MLLPSSVFGGLVGRPHVKVAGANSPPTSSVPAEMRCAVVGAGVTGARAVRQLSLAPEVERVGVVSRRDDRVTALHDSLGPKVGPLGADEVPEVVILAGSVGAHAQEARRWIGRGTSVVSVSPDPEDVAALCALDEMAGRAGRFVAAGVAFAPGLSTLLAGWAAARFDRVDEVHVALTGTAGPACERWATDALTGEMREWRDSTWTTRAAGGGGELVWFPDPVGARDVKFAASGETALLLAELPGLHRATYRIADPRKGLAARLLPWRRGMVEAPGAIRVEVRGQRGSGTEVVVLGMLDRPSTAAAATAAVVAIRAHAAGSRGAGGVLRFVDPADALVDLAARGVKAALLDPTA